LQHLLELLQDNEGSPLLVQQLIALIEEQATINPFTALQDPIHAHIASNDSSNVLPSENYHTAKRSQPDHTFLAEDECSGDIVDSGSAVSSFFTAAVTSMPVIGDPAALQPEAIAG
jgi:hypothetical protein